MKSLCELFFWGSGRRFKQCRNIAQAQRVLIVRLDAIGDMVLTTPFIRELRKNLPNAWITLVVSDMTLNLVELCPYVNEVLAFHQPNPGRLMDVRRIWGALKFASTHLWCRRLDVALAPRWDVDHYAASFLAYFSGANYRFGYSEETTVLKAMLNRGHDLLYSRVFNSSQLKHEVLRNLDLLDYVGLQSTNSTLELWTSSEDQATVQKLLDPFGLKHDEVLVALALGTKEPKKTWPLTRYIQLGKWLVEHRNVRFVLVGGENEVALGKKFEQQIPATINCIGKLSIRQSAVLLGRCQLYVGNDTGAMHLAAAVGTPIVEICCHARSGALKHYTSPARFGPWGVAHRVVQPARGKDACIDGCRESEPHCILGVHINEVQEAIDSLLPCRSQFMVTE